MSSGLGGLLPKHRLRRLELTITRRLDGLLHGQHQGLLPGAGSEAAGSREYRPGEDEVRRMDWAVTARTGAPHVRQLDADRELTTWLLADATPSMDFGTADLEKRDLAVAAVAAVGVLPAGAGNRLGAVVVGPDRIRRRPALTGRTHLLALLHSLLDAPRADGDGTSPALTEALDTLHRTASRRGLVVVVSDFLDGLPVKGVEPAWERPLRRLAARHQVLAIEVTDPRELELPDVGLITLVDPETGLRRVVPTGDRRLRERYAEAARHQRHLIGDALRRAGTTHLPLCTDRDWLADIVRHVRLHRHLARLGAVPQTRTPAQGGGR